MRKKLSGQPTSAEEEIHKSSLQRLNSQKQDTAPPHQVGQLSCGPGLLMEMSSNLQTG